MPPPYLLRSNLGGREERGAVPTPTPLWLDMGGGGKEPSSSCRASSRAGSRKEGKRKGSEGSVASAAATVAPLLWPDLGGKRRLRRCRRSPPLVRSRSGEGGRGGVTSRNSRARIGELRLRKKKGKIQGVTGGRGGQKRSTEPKTQRPRPNREIRSSI